MTSADEPHSVGRDAGLPVFGGSVMALLVGFLASLSPLRSARARRRARRSAALDAWGLG